MFAIVRFHVGHQLISGVLFDPQLQVGKIVGDRVGRNDFNRITTGNQIERQLSRTRMRAGDDPCECHKSSYRPRAFPDRVFDAETSSEV